MVDNGDSALQLFDCITNTRHMENDTDALFQQLTDVPIQRNKTTKPKAMDIKQQIMQEMRKDRPVSISVLEMYFDKQFMEEELFRNRHALETMTYMFNTYGDEMAPHVKYVMKSLEFIIRQQKPLNTRSKK